MAMQYHFLAETISKGKKVDHAMHNVCLDAIIRLYCRIFREELGVEIEHNIVWRDNAHTQYQCRQNFVRVASVPERHPRICTTHCLAIPDNFKGPHDSYGKEPQ